MDKKSVVLPDDKEIADRFVIMLEFMDNTMDNMAILANINKTSREALQLSVKRAASCARNVRREV